MSSRSATALTEIPRPARARHRGTTTRPAHRAGRGLLAGSVVCARSRTRQPTFDAVEEIHVAKLGTGGPACAREHHHALGDHALAIGATARGCAAPVARAASCAGSPTRWVGSTATAPPCRIRCCCCRPFPGWNGSPRISAPTARDRLTARLPMLRPPHPEGGLGALRVEVRGRRGSGRDERVLGVVDRPAMAAGAVVALAARWAVGGRLLRPGAAGLATLVEPIPFLARARRPRCSCGRVRRRSGVTRATAVHASAHEARQATVRQHLAAGLARGAVRHLVRLVRDAPQVGAAAGHGCP